jgi:hypothetical protein
MGDLGDRQQGSLTWKERPPANHPDDVSRGLQRAGESSEPRLHRFLQLPAARALEALLAIFGATPLHKSGIAFN